MIAVKEMIQKTRCLGFNPLNQGRAFSNKIMEKVKKTRESQNPVSKPLNALIAIASTPYNGPNPAYKDPIIIGIPRKSRRISSDHE